jgi:hypothetical protein
MCWLDLASTERHKPGREATTRHRLAASLKEVRRGFFFRCSRFPWARCNVEAPQKTQKDFRTMSRLQLPALHSQGATSTCNLLAISSLLVLAIPGRANLLRQAPPFAILIAAFQYNIVSLDPLLQQGLLQVFLPCSPDQSCITLGHFVLSMLAGAASSSNLPLQATLV